MSDEMPLYKNATNIAFAPLSVWDIAYLGYGLRAAAFGSDGWYGPWSLLVAPTDETLLRSIECATMEEQDDGRRFFYFGSTILQVVADPGVPQGRVYITSRPATDPIADIIADTDRTGVIYNFDLNPKSYTGFDANDPRSFIDITFQRGPIKEVGVNGCQTEDVIDVLIERLRGLNVAPYYSDDTVDAIVSLKDAKFHLNQRTADREARGVEGTNRP